MHVLVAGKGCAAVADAAAAVDGVAKVLVADDAVRVSNCCALSTWALKNTPFQRIVVQAYEHSIAENITALIEKIQGGASKFIAPLGTLASMKLQRNAGDVPTPFLQATRTSSPQAQPPARTLFPGWLSSWTLLL